MNSEVRFRQLLALLSGRTLQMRSPEDFGRLESAHQTDESGSGEWADGVRFIESLLRAIAAGEPGRPPGPGRRSDIDLFDSLG